MDSSVVLALMGADPGATRGAVAGDDWSRWPLSTMRRGAAVGPDFVRDASAEFGLYITEWQLVQLARYVVDRTGPIRTDRDSLWLSRLAELARLKHDWDGDGAVAPSALAIDVARSVVRALAAADMPLADVDAEAMGGIAVYLAIAGAAGERKSVRFVVRNYGTVLLVLDDVMARTTQAMPVEDYATAIEAARAFIGAPLGGGQA